jgi:hypothetical protein
MSDATETIVDTVAEVASETGGLKAFAGGIIAALVGVTAIKINRHFRDRRQAKKLAKAAEPAETPAQ